jgi:hypothetical protein
MLELYHTCFKSPPGVLKIRSKRRKYEASGGQNNQEIYNNKETEGYRERASVAID